MDVDLCRGRVHRAAVRLPRAWTVDRRPVGRFSALLVADGVAVVVAAAASGGGAGLGRECVGVLSAPWDLLGRRAHGGGRVGGRDRPDPIPRRVDHFRLRRGTGFVGVGRSDCDPRAEPARVYGRRFRRRSPTAGLRLPAAQSGADADGGGLRFGADFRGAAREKPRIERSGGAQYG